MKLTKIKKESERMSENRIREMPVPFFLLFVKGSKNLILQNLGVE